MLTGAGLPDSALVAFAGIGGFAGLRTADFSTVFAFAGLAFDAAVFVDIANTAGAAVGECLAGRKQSHGDNGKNGFHININLASGWG